jgi:hypothetical protein
MTAALVWSVIFLGSGNLIQAAERWHMTDKLGDRLRVVAPPKQPAPPKDKPAEQPQADADEPFSILGGKSTGEAA